MNEKQQTAVQWLLDQIENKNGKEFSSYYSEFIHQALSMEQDQIEKAYSLGELNAEQYFTDTYQTNK